MSSQFNIRKSKNACKTDSVHTDLDSYFHDSSLLGVGNFADWAIVSWPWKWSCFCVLEWNIIAWAVVFIIAFAVMIYVRMRKPANSFANKEE